MQFADFSPAPMPSLDQLRDALRKGLGRAMQWAKAARLENGPLLDACLQDLRHDRQVEGSRGDWLWRLIRAADAVDRLRVPILHALYDLTDDRAAYQLCELAYHYAETGDGTFRARLYQIVEQKPVADDPCLGEEEIVLLDGEKGFLVAARFRGETLAGREWEWYDDGLVKQAIERFGEPRVNDLWSSTTDRALAAYRDGWDRRKLEKVERHDPSAYREKMRAITVGDIVSAAEANRSTTYGFRGWARLASEDDLEVVLQHLWAAREPEVIARMLLVFANRACPRFDVRLANLCQHSDRLVRHRALTALGNIEDPLVREFALAELEKPGCSGRFAGLFVRNYRPGDEHRIRERVELSDDVDQIHWDLMNVIEVLEAHPEADCSQLAVIAYALTPCENCRSDAARLLIRQNVAPGWLIEECRFDSNEECRNQVEVITRPQPAEPESR